ncbi:MAG: RHS repeat-associated core domain-containing protein [Bacteroidota bacterium]
MEVKAQCGGSLNGPASLCSGTTGTLVFQGANGSTHYQLYVNGSASGTTFTGNPSPPYNQFTCNPGNSYQVRGSGGTCSTFTSNTVTVATSSGGSISIGGGNPNICLGNSVTLTASGGSSYSWNTGATGASITVSPTVNTTYTVTGTEPVCNTSRNASRTVNVSPKVTKPTTPSGPGSFCQGTASTSYTTSATNVSSYQWIITPTTAGSAGSSTSTGTVSWNAAYSGSATVTVRAFSGGSCSFTQDSDPYTVNLNYTPPAPTVSSPQIVEYNTTKTLTASGALAGETYKWYDNTGTLLGSGSPVVGPLNSATSYSYTASRIVSATGCETPSGSRSGLTLNLVVSPPAVSLSTNTCTAQTLTLPASPTNVTWYWEGTNSTGTDTSTPLGTSYSISTNGNYYVRAKASTLTLWSTPVLVSTNVDPVDIQLTSYQSSNPVVQATHSISLKPGFVVAAGSPFTGRIAITSECNDQVNWTETIAYDQNGAVIGDARTYLNGSGIEMQAMTMDYINGKVWGVQTLFNSYGKSVGSSLSAPIQENNFIYKPGLLSDASGSPYSADDFDKRTNTNVAGSGEINYPAPVGTQPGTIGWYYSSNNNYESRTATTQFPYSREFIPEGSDPTIDISADAGDAFRMGAGHEGKSERQPIVSGELDHYYQLRPYFVSTPLTSNPTVLSASINVNSSAGWTAVNGASITSVTGTIGIVAGTTGTFTGAYPIGGAITVASNKKYVFSVKGFTVGAGAHSPSLYVTTTTSTQLLVQAIPTGEDHWYSGVFTVPGGVTAINIGIVWNSNGVSGDAFTLEAIELHESSPSFYLGYKFISTDGDGKRSVTFVDPDGYEVASAVVISAPGVTPLSYDYWDYSYHSDAGEILATVAPKDINTVSGLRPPATIFKYDQLGRMIESSSPDEGTSQFVYSTDGKIRFSQSQIQRDATIKRFSYTNYDNLGRQIESGEYSTTTGSAYVFEPYTTNIPSTYSVLNLIDNTGFTGVSRTLDNVRCTDYVYFTYDVAGSGAPVVQNFLIGRVSKTENANASTWYSYDEFGNVVWTIQSISALGSKRIDYTYDYLGNVTQVAYQAGQADAFYHHYEYDIEQKLANVYTSPDGTIKTLRAKYYYYQHGPLKRVELLSGSNKIQGIDYVYNIEGSLKAINHSDPLLDPGNDGAGSGFPRDVFGMALDYFSGDYTGANFSTLGSMTTPGYTDSFTGLIKAQRWHSAVDNHSKAGYAYVYDTVDELLSANWGSVTGSSGSYSFSASSPQSFKESIGSYDKNGNIMSLTRNGKGTNVLGNYTYNYASANNNQLTSITGGTHTVSYTYDSIGQMIQQVEGSNTMKISYNVFGLVNDVRDAANNLLETYTYDDNGDIVKKEIYNAGVLKKTNWYIRDASGKPFAIYETIGTTTSLIEQPVYGADRIGMMKSKVGGLKYFYEVKDHLGNVRAVIGDPTTESPVATYENVNATSERGNFLRYDNARRVGSPLFDHTNESTGGTTTTLYTNDFSASRTPIQSNGTIVLSLVSGRLKATNAGAYNQVYLDIATSAGSTYKVTVDVDVNSGPAMVIYANDQSLGQILATVSVSTTGTYTYNFTAMTSSTRIFFNNSSTGPRDFYLDNMLIENLSPGGAYAERLNGSTNEKYGVARSLSVMPGDTVKLEVFAKYVDTNSANWTTAFNTLIGQVSAHIVGVVVDGTGYNTSTSSFGFGGLVNTSGSTGGPKAYLNWLIFDRNYTLMNGGYVRLSSAAREYGQNVAHERLAISFTVNEPSYVYTFLSNEEPTGSPVDVYFDDFKVTQVHGTVVAGGDYYPFGLPIDTRQMTQENYRFGYQGQYSEKDSLTGWNSFQLRMYDTRFGRWISPDPNGQFASPYLGMGNVPHLGADSDGGWVSMFGWKGALIGAAVGAGVGLAVDKDNWGWYALGGAAAGGFLTSDFAKIRVWGTHDLWGIGAAPNGREYLRRIYPSGHTMTASTFTATRNGLNVELLFKKGLLSGLADFRWIQTIRTNDPLGGADPPYNDPQPPDDGKPFYWTDPEEITYGRSPGSDSRFSDVPSRRPTPGKTIRWEGELSLVGKNSAGRYEAVRTMRYGFKIKNGAVKLKPIREVRPSGFQRRTIKSAR